MKGCKKTVHHGYLGMGSHPCSRPIFKDGFCKVHHPDSVKARRDNQELAFNEKQKLQEAASKRAKAANRVIDIIVAAEQTDEIWMNQPLRGRIYRLAKIAKGEKP